MFHSKQTFEHALIISLVMHQVKEYLGKISTSKEKHSLKTLIYNDKFYHVTLSRIIKNQF